ncbi:hypothetical protein [Nostoc sp. 'Peltigera malacea cyanobiont' DB3992]|nr:hypothetical protein [Nostoc sp. 'Peltigera malacea cyanobiont' DB3992]
MSASKLGLALTASSGSSWDDLLASVGTAMLFKIASINHPPWMNWV